MHKRKFRVVERRLRSGRVRCRAEEEDSWREAEEPWAKRGGRGGWSRGRFFFFVKEAVAAGWVVKFGLRLDWCLELGCVMRGYEGDRRWRGW